MTRWRIGSVPFLNERPLTVALEEDENIELERLPPGPLADKLAAGEFDVALIPVAEQLRHGLEAVGGLGIACRGPVESVRVWHECPREKLARILVPTHSRSSVMLLRLLLTHWGCPDAELVPTEYPEDMAEPPDEPALIIGDSALRCLAAGRPSTDLGAAWHELTGLPFVFARWVGRPGLAARLPASPIHDYPAIVGAMDRLSLESLLLGAHIASHAHPQDIAATEGPARGISVERALAYLSETVVYALDESCEAGQAEFARRAREAGLLDR